MPKSALKGDPGPLSPGRSIPSGHGHPTTAVASYDFEHAVQSLALGKRHGSALLSERVCGYVIFNSLKHPNPYTPQTRV